jgi:hypothetical protein
MKSFVMMLRYRSSYRLTNLRHVSVVRIMLAALLAKEICREDNVLQIIYTNNETRY